LCTVHHSTGHPQITQRPREVTAAELLRAIHRAVEARAVKFRAVEARAVKFRSV